MRHVSSQVRGNLQLCPNDNQSLINHLRTSFTEGESLLFSALHPVLHRNTSGGLDTGGVHANTHVPFHRPGSCSHFKLIGYPTSPKQAPRGREHVLPWHVSSPASPGPWLLFPPSPRVLPAPFCRDPGLWVSRALRAPEPGRALQTPHGAAHPLRHGEVRASYLNLQQY